jgi:coenzyme F420-0:L-glutamate ligase/coenzyme F420-1:gamma-L-glutamate ligase
MSSAITLTSIPHIPHIQPGDHVAELLIAALDEAGICLQDGDVLAIAQKVISKAEGRFVNLNEVIPGARAERVAKESRGSVQAY